MRAARFTVGEGRPRLGRVEDEAIVDAGPAPAEGFDGSDGAWAQVEDGRGHRYRLDEVRCLPPSVPEKIIAVGLNYQSHVNETSLSRPDEPFGFAIWPNALLGHGEEIVVPIEETRPDWEGEIAVIIGRKTYRADQDEARAAIGAITAFNDVSGRRAQLETPMRQFTLGKSFDTFAPIGPFVAKPDTLDLDALTVETKLNEEVVQEGRASDLIFGFEALIQYFSRGVTLKPGDVIATGTPGGVGDEREPPRYLVDGDVIEVTVRGVATLINRVRLESV